MEKLIEIKNLNKTIDQNVILSDISFNIPDSSFYGIIGESGAGKSTLLKCMNKLTDFQQGQVIIDKFDVKELAEEDLRLQRFNMGMIFQNFALLEQKTVYKNISLPLELWNYDLNDIKERVYKLAKLVDIEKHLHKRPRELSGGQKQRVAIARALSSQPKYLLCDECTSALDPENSIMIMDLLNQIQEELGVTVIIVTHDMLIAKAYCTHIAFLKSGELLAADNAEIVVKNYPDIFLDDYTRREF
ncbi:ATP-binding cassette domain-containing protein [Facklamia sp. DSM 111018]|uniref:ATP-binding cassette domain-containing protein n=1 Tax=Facklamia lactis TaxID=2749967 RepID=A0ABS0LQZ0_9LACT|nr:ATP-binding cassette domain-containing protein [Facklamia lactis]MBG9986372.1 ATP-binding cassette domain-containing protein [Facklamia lactis]